MPSGSCVGEGGEALSFNHLFFWAVTVMASLVPPVEYLNMLKDLGVGASSI